MPLSAAPEQPASSTTATARDRVSYTSRDGTRFSVGSSAGIYFGLARELVYYSTPSVSYYKVSELDWPLQPSYYGGAHFSLDTRSGFTATASFRAGIPSPVGTVTDSDYLNGDGVKTNYSQHSGKLDRSLAATADIGWTFPTSARLSLVPLLRFAFLDFKWAANDGYYQYPPASETSPPYTPWSSSEPKTYLYGPVALYEQRYAIPALGIAAEYHRGGAVTLGASLAYSPLAYFSDIDNHLLRQLIFYDSAAFCTYVEPAFTFSYRPANNIKLTFDFSFLNVISPRGGTIVTYDTTTDKSYTYAGTSSTAGASIQAFSLSLGLHLFR